MVKKKKYSKNIVSINETNQKKEGILKNKGFWGLIIIFLMLGSVLSLSFFYKGDDQMTDKVEYNGYVFVNNGNGWTTNFQGQEVAFEYLPKDLEDIQVEKPNLIISGSQYSIGFIPGEYSEESYEVLRLKSLLVLKGINAFPGCLKEENCGNLPLVKCNDNTIILKSGNETKGYYDNCYIIEGDNEGMLKAINKFIYLAYGII